MFLRLESLTEKLQWALHAVRSLWNSPAKSLLKIPGKPQKRTLVLDLDETLVHSHLTLVADYDFHLTVGSCSFYVKKRPFLEEFLKEAAELFEVVLFTASAEEYASPVIKTICQGVPVAATFYRQHCSRIGCSYVKDLSRLNRPLANVTIVDNSPVAYSLQPENAISISSYYGNKDDRQLKALLCMLKVLAKSPIEI